MNYPSALYLMILEIKLVTCVSLYMSVLTICICNFPIILILYVEKFRHGKIGEFGKSRAFHKIFLANIHRYIKSVFGICTDFSLLAKVFLASSFYLYGLPKLFPVKVFPRTVFKVSIFKMYLN